METVPETAKILNEVLPSKAIRDLARATGTVQRIVKVDIVVLVWTIVLAPKNAAAMTLAAMKTLFETMSHTTIAPSAFQGRFSDEFAKLMRGCVEYLLGKTGVQGQAPKLFKGFTDVLAIDSSLIKLPDCLASIFPGPRNNTAPAAMKVNAVYSVLRQTMTSVAIAKGTKAEVKFLKVDQTMAGTLLLFDLGYFCFRLFRRIVNNDSFFVSRLKSNVNPKIVADNTSGPGKRRNLVGMKVKDAVKNLCRDELDVLVEVYPKKRAKSKPPKPGHPRKRRKTKPLRLRIVGVRHPLTHEFHLYITNIPGSSMTPEQVRVAYSSRWIVELVFKELKSDCGMDKLPSKKQNVIEALVFASIVRLMLNRQVVEGLIARISMAAKDTGGEQLKQAMEKSLRKRLPTRRAMKALSVFGPFLLPYVINLATGRDTVPILDQLILAAMHDPNNDRPRLSERIVRAKEEAACDFIEVAA